MSICANCGNALPEGAYACPNCGTIVNNNVNNVNNAFPVVEESSKKPGGIKMIAIIAAALAVVALIAILVINGIANKPANLINKAIANTLEEVSDSDGMKVLKNGSVEISADLAQWELEDMIGDEIPFAGKVKLYFGGNEYFALSANVANEGEALVDLSAYLSQSKVTVECPQLLPESYGIDLTKAAENLEKSVFAPDAAYELDEETFEQLKGMLESINNYDPKLSDKLSEKFAEYWKLAVEKACKLGDAEKKTENISIGDDKVSTTAVTLKLDQDDLADLITELRDKFVKDEKLRKLLAEALELAYNSNPSLKEEFDSVDKMLDEIYDQIESDDFEDEMEDLRDAEIELNPVFYVAKSGKHLAAFELKTDAEGEETEIRLELGKNLKDSKCNKLTFKTEYEKIEITREVKEDTNKARVEEFVVKEDGEKLLKAAFELDKKEDTFKLKADVEGEEIKAEGTYVEKGGKTEITVTEIGAEDETIDVNLSIVINTNDSAPKASKFKEVLTMSEDEFDQMYEDISDNAQELIENNEDLTEVFNALTSGASYGYEDYYDYEYGYDYGYDYDYPVESEAGNW